ncbi:MAG TPA: DUF2254 family protein, partial [Porticoccaceae bacterium]
AALAERLAVPYLGATPWPDDDVIPAAAVPVHACAIGYIQFIDMPVLAELCDEVDCEAYFPCNPGTFVFEDTVLAWLLAPHELPEGQDIQTPLTRKVRYLDKLVDELAKGKTMDKILREDKS